jgi:PhzF family phenazine biosynthesis protein
VFTNEEELDFAGHPVLGAAGVLHFSKKPREHKCSWSFKLNKGIVSVNTELRKGFVSAVMDQGAVEFGEILNKTDTLTIMESMNLKPDDLYLGCHPEVISTGLPYLILPLRKNGFKAKIMIPDLEELLNGFGAKFIGIVEYPSLNIRTWNNSGTIEDIATGSLAGPVGGWLVKHHLKNKNERFTLNQGSNMSRPSQIFVEIRQGRDISDSVYVGGDVIKIGKGTIDI